MNLKTQLRLTSIVRVRGKYGSKDILIIAILAVLMVIALVYILFRIIGQSEKHVEKVRKTKVDYEESLSWRPDSQLCEKRIYQDLKSNPRRKKISYEQLELSEKCFKYISKMVQLKTLDLKDSVVKDDWLKHLVNLPLKSINLNGTDITDKGIKEIVKIKTLKNLSIGQAVISDESLILISQHPNLNFLGLDRTRITDNGLKHLVAKKQDLLHLDLSTTKITPASLDTITQMKNLKSLNLQGLHLNNEQIDRLSSLKKLRSLNLSYAKLTDKDIESIYKFKKLIRLEISTNYLTDKSLIPLGRLKKLIFLDISQSPDITTEAVAKFEKAHPRCKVKYSKNITDIPQHLNLGNIQDEVDLLQGQVNIRREKKRIKKLEKQKRREARRKQEQ